MAANLSSFKERGSVNYLAVINKIPLEDRLPSLAVKYSRQSISAIISVSLTSCFEKMNLRYGMSADQIVELSEMVIDASEEDMLAFEDVLLFLQRLVKGEMGKIYDRMDIPVFFEMFEKYRQERHENFMNHKYEMDSQFKAVPINERIVESSEKAEREKDRIAMKDYLKTKL